MTCAAWQDLLDEGALHTLEEAPRAALEAHAATCPHCGPRVATERLLAEAWSDQRRLQPSARLQAALLAVPRRGQRLRAYSLWVVPVSMLVIGLLALLEPDLLRRQRRAVDLPARPTSGDAVAAPATATVFSSPGKATAAQAPAASVDAGRTGTMASGTRDAGLPTPARPFARGTASAAAAATPPPAPASAAGGNDRGVRRNPAATATPAPEDGPVGAKTGPGPSDPVPPEPSADPGPDDPVTTPEAGGTPPGGAGLRPGPAETATPEGPPSRQPEPAPPVETPTPEDPRIVKTPPPSPPPTEAPGGVSPIVPPTETPTPTPTPTGTPTGTPTVMGYGTEPAKAGFVC